MQPIAFIAPPLGGSGEAGLPELPDGNRAERAREISGTNPVRNRKGSVPGARGVTGSGSVPGAPPGAEP